MVRTAVPPASFSEGARAAVWSIDPDLPLRRLISMEDQVAFWTAEPRFYSLLFGAFALRAVRTDPVEALREE